MFKHISHNKGSNDTCDHCHKEVPYYLLTNVGLGEAVCNECLAYVEDEYDYINDEDFED